jgi:hypothetical protein
MRKLASWLAFGLLVMVWVSSHSHALDRPLTPVATVADKDQDQALQRVRQAFWVLPCFQGIRDLKVPVPSGVADLGADHDQVEIPAPLGSHDAFSYTLFIHRADQRAFLLREGGLAGVQELHGPMDLSACLKQALAPPMVEH